MNLIQDKTEMLPSEEEFQDIYTSSDDELINLFGTAIDGKVLLKTIVAEMKKRSIYPQSISEFDAQLEQIKNHYISIRFSNFKTEEQAALPLIRKQLPAGSPEKILRDNYNKLKDRVRKATDRYILAVRKYYYNVVPLTVGGRGTSIPAVEISPDCKASERYNPFYEEHQIKITFRMLICGETNSGKVS